jgi:hypothetical protein
MHQPVEMAGRFFNLLTQIIIGIEVKHVCHEVESILVIGNFRVQTSEVEPIRQVILVDFTKVLISARRDELKKKGRSMVS